MAGPFPPPKYKRGTYFGEDWTNFNRTDSSFGVIARGRLVKLAVAPGRI